jgi:hypothetical protein
MSTLREQKGERRRSTKPRSDLLRGRTELPQAVRSVLCSIEMLTATERDPLEQAVFEASEQKVCDLVQAFQVLVADSVPVRVDWIGITSLARSRPRVQAARSENPFFCSQVDEGLTNMEDALQPDAEPAHLASIFGLRSTDRQVQSIAVPGRKRSVICHQQRRSPKQGVLGLRPATSPEAEHQSFSASIICILNELSQKGSPVTEVLINIGKERLDGLDLVESAANDARVRTSVNLRHGYALRGSWKGSVS